MSNPASTVYDEQLPDATSDPNLHVRRAVVHTLRNNRLIVHLLDNDGYVIDREIPCTFLQTSCVPPPTFGPGDAVLVSLFNDTGVVIGKEVALGHASIMQEEIVIEATDCLTLKCGEGSITIRGDGKVAIRGVDLVSRAKRSNRVKGSSVAIN